jgi:hypothetical protein
MILPLRWPFSQTASLPSLEAYNGSDFDFALARYHPDGSSPPASMAIKDHQLLRLL